MSKKPFVVLIGAGGHAKVVIEMIRDAGTYAIEGLIGSNPTAPPVLGVPVLGDDSELARLHNRGLRFAFAAVGDNRRRLALGRLAEQEGFEIVSVVSPRSIVSPSAKIARGVAIMPGAIVNAETVLDDFCIVNTKASIDHDCWIGEAVHVGPGSSLAGNVTIRRLAFLGTGTNVIPGICVGEGAVVGAGSCVISDIPAGAIAKGVPATVADR